jgi:hypothetical protein
MPLLMPYASPSTLPFYDNSANVFNQNGIASGAAFTPWTQPVAAPVAGTRNYGIVALCAANATTYTLSAVPVVTFGGVTLSSLGNVLTGNTASQGWLWVFGAFDIPSGSQTVTAKLTQSGDVFYGNTASFTFLNVSSVGALQTSFGSSTWAESLTVPSAPGNLVWAIFMQGVGSPGPFGASPLNVRQAATTAAGAYTGFQAGDIPGIASTVITAQGFNFYLGCSAGLNLI